MIHVGLKINKNLCSKFLCNTQIPWKLEELFFIFLLRPGWFSCFFVFLMHLANLGEKREWCSCCILFYSVEMVWFSRGLYRISRTTLSRSRCLLSVKSESQQQLYQFDSPVDCSQKVNQSFNWREWEKLCWYLCL